MSKNLLQQYFPMIRSRHEIMNVIRDTPTLLATFQNWDSDQQQEFLDFCSGERGLKILYDTFFKEILNPEYAPQRLEFLLSTILKQTVKILQVLPGDATRLADETSLLVTDIVVELADHSIANVEIQKIGYHFPGQRSACYSADLLLRQYKRLRDTRKKKFNYKDVQNVYTIIFFENSTREFHNFPDTYLHYFTQKSDTGLELDLLQKYYFIPLDIFRENIHNKNIPTNLDAWLVFLTTDEPAMILKLIETFPAFKEMYQDIYELCRNIEGVMTMFSKELQELDRNTVQYMIDEMQNEINEQKRKLSESEKRLNESEKRFNESEKQLIDTTEKLNQNKHYMHLTNTLYAYLMHDSRQEDLARALTDDTFREQLLREYQLV